jgi:hypothetical protein
MIVDAPQGFGRPEVGDVEVFPEGDRLHLVHLPLPAHDVVQRAVSDDGWSWQTLPSPDHTLNAAACGFRWSLL